MKEQTYKQTIKNRFKGLLFVFTKEMKSLFKDQGILIFFLLVPLLYPLLYAFIYTNEVVREVPIVIVDNSNSSLSRQFVRQMDATADVSVKAFCTDMEEGKEWIKQGKVYGIVYIPKEFSYDLAKGKQTQVSIFCDMSGMLYYKAILIAATDVSLEMNKEIKIARMGNSTQRQDEIGTAPIKYQDVALYNPQNGFASFLIPAVLILIIQQTLLLGVGMSAGTARENNRFRDLVPLSSMYLGTLRSVLGKSIAYFLIYVAVTAYIVCVVPTLFGLIRLADPMDLALFLTPYILACIFFAMTLSVFIHHRESCMMIYVFTSIPLLFISGISWPGVAIPAFWKGVSWIFPSTFGINGFVRLNSMGATLEDVSIEFWRLWLQAAIYFITTCIAYKYQVKRAQKHLNSSSIQA